MSLKTNLKAGSGISVLLILLLISVGCIQKQKINNMSPTPPAYVFVSKDIMWGKAGESAELVTKHYNWTCFNNDKYREISR